MLLALALGEPKALSWSRASGAPLREAVRRCNRPRRAAFERLEDRTVLSGGVVFTRGASGYASFLDSNENLVVAGHARPPGAEYNEFAALRYDANGILAPTFGVLPPSISINDVSVTEGHSGTVNAVFTVTLSEAAAAAVIVNFASANGTATAGSDYLATAGTLTFSPSGPLTHTIIVTVNGDTMKEANETFVVNLSGATGGAVISDGQGVGTITNDDGKPRSSSESTAALTDAALAEWAAAESQPRKTKSGLAAFDLGPDPVALDRLV